MKMQNFAFANIFIVIIVYFQNGFADLHWINHLVKYIENESKTSQTLLIIDEEENFTSNNTIDNVLRKIQFIPHHVIRLKNATISHAKQMSQNLQFKNLKTNTFILTILSLENKNFSKVFELAKFLIHLHNNGSRTKCLTIVSSGNNQLRYKKFLHKMWLNDFLDFTIIEISQNETTDTCLQLIQSGNIRIHQYRPFTDSYTIKKYNSKKQQFFVNKLLNMNNFEMKVGSFNMPPHVFVKRNSTGHPVKVSGPNVNIVREVAAQMHFKTVEVASQNEWFGMLRTISHDKETDISLMDQLYNKRIRLITNWHLFGYEPVLTWSKVIKFDSFCALIPASENTNWNVHCHWTWPYFVIFVLAVKGLTWIIKFDKQSWSWNNILLITLGFAVPNEPQIAIERSIFALMLILFMIFSSAIVATLTNMKMTIDPLTAIDTLEKLNRSHLTPMTRYNYITAISKKNLSIVIRDLLKKTLNISSEEECVRLAAEQKNISCFLRQSLANVYIQKYKNSDGSSQLKIIDEVFAVIPLSMLLEPASPFVDSFNKIMTNLFEFGVVHFWYKASTETETKDVKGLENREEVLLLQSLLQILLSGYIFSIIAFVGEIAINYIGKICKSVILRRIRQLFVFAFKH